MPALPRHADLHWWLTPMKRCVIITTSIAERAAFCAGRLVGSTIAHIVEWRAKAISSRLGTNSKKRNAAGLSLRSKGIVRGAAVHRRRAMTPPWRDIRTTEALGRHDPMGAGRHPIASVPSLAHGSHQHALQQMPARRHRGCVPRTATAPSFSNCDKPRASRSRTHPAKL